MKIRIWGPAVVVATVFVTGMAQAQISLSIAIAPPELPVYEQPAIPGDGYMWTPGYWSWNAPDNDYYWVPGTWVSSPFVGALWTPGYWGWGDSGYNWHGGYWGTQIGYYGGINYGYGYGGVGYQGGHWNNGAFSYNRSVNNIGSVQITHVYNTRVTNTTINHVSYNGGSGGVRLQPTKAEQAIAKMPHSAPTAPQMDHEQSSRTNQDLRASVNHGIPKIAATPEPGAFKASGVVAAKSGQVQVKAQSQPQPHNTTHANTVTPPQTRDEVHAAAAPSPEPRGEAEERPARNAGSEPEKTQRQPAPHEEERHEK
jgi:hypothetical protein